MTERSRDDLERARAKWWATVSSGDLDGYLSLFAEDAVWVTPELDEIAGRDAIRAWLEPVFAQFDYELTITVADVRVAGDLGIERARFVSRMTPKPVAPSAPLPSPPAPEPEPLPAQQWVPGDDEVPAAASPPSWAEGHAVEAGERDPDEADAPVDDEAPVAAAVERGVDAEVEPEWEPEEPEPVEAPLVPVGPDAGDDEPHEGRYLMYWRWHEGAGWLVHRYADVTGVG